MPIVRRPKPVLLELPGRGRYVLPEAIEFLGLVPPQGTVPGQLRFRVGVRQELFLPLSLEVLADLATGVVGHKKVSS
jgi:hypothetical protein